MATTDRFVRIVEELEAQNERLNDWAREFVASIREAIDKNYNLSAGRKNKLIELQEEYIEGKTDSRHDKNLINYGTIQGRRIEGAGWQAFIDGDAVGPNMTRKDALSICQWLSEAWEELQILMNAIERHPSAPPKIIEQEQDTTVDTGEEAPF